MTKTVLLLSTLLCVLAAPSLAGDSKLKTPENPVITLPEGFRLAAVVRPKQIGEVLAANGLPADVLGALGSDFPNPFPNASLTQMVTVVVGMGEGAHEDSRLVLVSLASACSMDEFLQMIGESRTPEMPGDEKYRERVREEGGVRHVMSCRQFSPQDYLFGRQRVDRPIAQPGKVLSSLRAAVANAGHLVWFCARGERLPEAMTAGKFRAGLKVANIRGTIDCPGDLVIHAEGTLSTDEEATSIAKALELLVPPMPGSEAVPAGIAPHQHFGSSGRTATYDLVFPKASLGLSAAAFLKGFANGFNRSSPARDYREAQNIAASHAAACAAGSKAMNSATSVEEIMALLEKGVTPEDGPFKTSRFEVKLQPPTEARRKAVAALLVLDNGSLKFTPEALNAIDETDRKADAAPPGSGASIAKAKRNAQTLAAMHGAAMAAGSLQLEKIDTLRGAIDALVKGVNGAGKFSGSIFKVPLSENEITQAMTYLRWEEGQFAGIRYIGATEVSDSLEGTFLVHSHAACVSTGRPMLLRR